MADDDYHTVIAAACQKVIEQAPHDLRPGSCQNYAIALAYLLRRAGLAANLTGGAAWWQTATGPIEYDPAVDPDSFHCWVAIDAPAGPIYADASTHTLPGLPPYMIWREGSGITEPIPRGFENCRTHDDSPHTAWRYIESDIPLPQVIQARKQLLCALQGQHHDQRRPRHHPILA